MTEQHARPLRKQRPKWVVPVLACGVAVFVFALIAGIWITVVSQNSSQPKAPSTTPKPAVLETYSAATFTGWAAQNDTDKKSTFSVQSTAVHDGKVALRLQSSTPASITSRKSLSQKITVEPHTEYQLTIWVRSAKTPTSTALISVGTDTASQFALPATNGVWKQVSFAFTTSNASAVVVQMATTAPTTGLQVDQLSMALAAGGPNLLANGSFENYSSPTRITSRSLVLTTGSAALDVTCFGPQVNWTVANENGVVAAMGKQSVLGGVSKIRLASLKQGYYFVHLQCTGQDNSPVESALLVLDKPAPGRSASDDRFGVGVHMGAIQYVGSEPLVSQIGYAGVRDDANWNSVETTKGKYTFPPVYEAPHAAFAKDGVQVLPIPGYRNKSYDNGKTPSTPAALNAYANFANAFVSHYSSPAIDIYNEYNGFSDSACGKTAACYVPLLKASYEKIKADHPNTTIVGPSIAFLDKTWLHQFYEEGGLNYLDVVAFHPYGLQAAPEYLVSDLANAASDIKHNNDGVAKPFWVTELGFTTNTIDNGVSERTQSDYLVRAQIASLSAGAQKYYYYDLVDDSLDPTDHEGHFGIFQRPSATVASFVPKPAAMAQAVVIREISGKAFAGRDSIGDASYSYAFGTGAQATRVAWSPIPVTVSYATKKPIRLVTEYGHVTTLQPRNGQITVQLSGEPVYLTGAITGVKANAELVASIATASASLPQGASIPLTLAVDLRGKDSVKRTSVFTIDEKKYTVAAAEGKLTKKTVNLPAGSTIGLRSINVTVGEANKPDTYLTTPLTIAPQK